MPQFNRATISMKSLGTLILESDLKAKDIDKKLNSAVKQLNSGKLTEENVALFCTYVRKLIQILESIRIYVEREQFIEVSVLRKWEGYINKKRISQFDIGAEKIFDSIHSILLKSAPRFRRQLSNEARLMKGKHSVHSSFSNILLNDSSFYAKIEEESEFVRSNIQRIHMLNYEVQSALLKLSSAPNKENLEAFRRSMMRLLRHISEDLFVLFDIEEKGESIEANLVKEIDSYIAITKGKKLDSLTNQLEQLKDEVINYFQKDLKDAKQMFMVAYKFIQESEQQEKEDENKVIVEELLDENTDLFHQAYRMLTKNIPLPFREKKSFMRYSLNYKLGNVSFPLINHVIIARKGNHVVAVLYGQYMARANFGLIGYVVSDHSKDVTAVSFSLFNHLFSAFQNDARRHGKNLWLIVGEMDADETNSYEARLIRIGFRRYGGIPLDFDYYQPPMSTLTYVFYKLPLTNPKKLVLFVMSLAGKINGLTRSDLITLLEVLYEDTYGISTNHKFFKMTLASIGNREFIGPKEDLAS